MSTRGHCSPRWRRARTACRGGRRAPGGARGPRSSREPARGLSARPAVCARWGRNQKPETSPEGARRTCARVAWPRYPRSGSALGPTVGLIFPPRTRRPRCRGSRDWDLEPGSGRSSPPLPPWQAGPSGPLRGSGPSEAAVVRAAVSGEQQGGHPETSALPGPWGARVWCVSRAPVSAVPRGGTPATPPRLAASLPAASSIRHPHRVCVHLAAHPGDPDDCRWGGRVDPRSSRAGVPARRGDRAWCSGRKDRSARAPAHTGLWPLWGQLLLLSLLFFSPSKPSVSSKGGAQGPWGTVGTIRG